MRIGGLRISPPLALAPMVGLSHSALRSLILEIGGVGLFFSEMLSIKRLPSENEKISPFLIRDARERPLFYQIFPSSKSDIEPALLKLQKLDAQGIDVNLGCPAPQVRRIGAGSALGENIDDVKKILRLIRKATDLPLSVKIRLGQNRQDQHGFLHFCKVLEGEGVDCIIIHARFNKEKFCRKPQWDWIAAAKNATKIPIIANGGIQSVEDAVRCLKTTEADGLMIGTAAVQKPWLFRDIAYMVFGVEPKKTEILASEIYFQFMNLLEKRFRAERRLGRLKEFTHYFASSYIFGHQLATSIQKSRTISEAKINAEKFFAGNEELRV